MMATTLSNATMVVGNGIYIPFLQPSPVFQDQAETVYHWNITILLGSHR